jgi:hypothetical protein
MCNCSNVFISGPFFSMCSMSIVSSIVLYVCYVSKMCCVYLEFVLFVLIACTCSLHLVLNFLPVCSMYLSWKSLYFIQMHIKADLDV